MTHPLPGFGGKAWRFYPIVAAAVQNCSTDFSNEELSTEIKTLFEEEFENFEQFPTLEDIDELTLWEINIWPLNEAPSSLDPFSLPTEDPINEEDPFEAFIPVATSSRNLACYLKFYRTMYGRPKW